MLCLCSNLVLSLGQRPKYYVMSMFKFSSIIHKKLFWRSFAFIWYASFFTLDGMVFLSCFFILDNNWIPCFPENGRHNCSFVSLMSVVFGCGLFVMLTFSFSCSFLIMFFNCPSLVIVYFYKILFLNTQVLHVIGVDKSM